jgi:peptidoglycan/LPS O-acetylase OafA/YrhL
MRESDQDVTDAATTAKKRIYFENLDGLRFLCFLSVFLYHSFFTDYPEIKSSGVYHFVKFNLFGNGNIGVNFFFVLSGFLITFLLIEEKKMNGQISLKNFWIRRILRIWPLFYLCVFFGFMIFPKIKLLLGQVPHETANPVYYLTFLNNFDFIKNGLPDASVLGVLWSVAIEEQFYLVWPVILFLFPIRNLWIPFLIIMTASLIFRALNNTSLMYEHHTLSCIGDMTIGAIGAWLINISDKFKFRIETFSRRQIAFIYALFVIIFFFRDELFFSNLILRIFERSIIAVVMLLIILEQTYSKNSLFKMSRYKKITRLGTVSYGLYCLHFIGILITIKLTAMLGINRQLWQVIFIDTPLALMVTILISRISYRYYETPFLKLKQKFSFITK